MFENINPRHFALHLFFQLVSDLPILLALLKDLTNFPLVLPLIHPFLFFVVFI